MVHHNTCLVCSSDKLERKFICTDHFVSKETFAVVRCTACGFIFTQDHPEEQGIARYYESEDYISHSDTSKGIINKLFKYARDFMLKRKTALVRKVTGIEKGRILDIGSGTGYFAGAMKRKGWQAEGMEINRKAREYSENEFGLKVYDPSAIVNIPAESYDCITLWHVLEHFHDPGAYMANILRLLKPGGSCIIALPNSNSLDAHKYKEYWAAWDVPRHLWHFSQETFEKFALKNNFRVTGIKALPLDAFYISMLSEKYKGSKMHFVKGLFRGNLFVISSMFNKRKSSTLVYFLKKR